MEETRNSLRRALISDGWMALDPGGMNRGYLYAASGIVRAEATDGKAKLDFVCGKLRPESDMLKFVTHM